MKTLTGEIWNTVLPETRLYKSLKDSNLRGRLIHQRAPSAMRTTVRMVSPTGEIWNTVFAQLNAFNSLRDMSLAA
jgi:hypothetical protein